MCVSAVQGGAHGGAVLYVTAGHPGPADQQASHGSDETSTGEVDLEDDQQLIENSQEADVVSRKSMLSRVQADMSNSSLYSQVTLRARLGCTRQKGSGIVGASFNIINSIVGAGMIGIPAAIREAGFSTGVVLLVLVGLLTDYTLYILVSTGIAVNCFSYQEVMRKAFGKIGYVLVTITQFASPFFGELAEPPFILPLTLHPAFTLLSIRLSSNGGLHCDSWGHHF